MSSQKYIIVKMSPLRQDYSQQDFDFIVDGWRQKQVRCAAGDQAWGLFMAKK